MAGSSIMKIGGGANFLCMHPQPQHPAGYNDASHNGNSNWLWASQYVDPDGKRNVGDAACAVCQDNAATAVYVQWGRTNCSNGHTTQYSGLVMSSIHNGYKVENVCVDVQLALIHTTKPNTTKPESTLYRSFMEDGASDERQYPHGGELACAVCSPAKPTRMFTHWGSRTCPTDRATKVYGGFMAGSRARLGKQVAYRGGGINFLCMHPLPQPTGNVYDGEEHMSNRLHGVEYAKNGVLDKNVNQDAACAVCEYHHTPAVYVQWGRTTCSNGHITQYSGLVMSSARQFDKAESVCVDLQRAVHPASDKTSQAAVKLYSTEMFTNLKPLSGLYHPWREVACVVCSPRNQTGGQ